MQRTPLFLAAIAAIAAAPLVAQMPTTPPGTRSVAKVAAGTYKVDTGHTQVVFSLNHLGFSEYTGQFTQPTGSMTIDPKNPAAAKVEIAFPIAKVSTTVAALDEHLQKPEFFDAAKFPEARFVSTKVAVNGMNATITGNLTLHGVTKPVVLNAKFIGAGPSLFGAHKTNVGFAATTSIKRSDFGVNGYLPLVGDKVDLTINAAFEAE
ncbi:YceI family protein [Sphingomonas sp. PvP056]|jgi:polyisoprenoid-binding protein YceI|uniref:YceI family protein n=1 Tax=Sphingomonas sp. PvP056 TaxID=3156392 RepID=UPI00263F45B8|nr:YceI family protein [Sphingomonas sp. PsM26]